MASTAKGVKVLHKALDVLEGLKLSNGMTLADLARAVEMPKPTVYRILVTLETRGYLNRGEGGRFAISRKLLASANGQAPLEQALFHAASSAMKNLVEICKETVNLGVLDGGEVVVINAMESPLAVRMTSKIGNRRYLHSTALGKVLLSGLPDDAVKHLLRIKGTPRLTGFTVTSKPAIMKAIRKIREQGYAVDDQENEMEGRCVASGISLPDGRLVAALSISSPVFRTDMARLQKLIPRLREACAAISAGLGAG